MTVAINPTPTCVSAPACSDQQQQQKVMPVIETAIPSSHLPVAHKKFWPKLWLQRRSHALRILRDHSTKVDWVADFGCNECALAQALVQTSDFTRLTCVDLDMQVFDNVHLGPNPSIHDQPSNRARPMTIDLIQGSIVEFDQRLVGVDAITLLEVVEHLDPLPLSLLPQALFKHYRPKLVIVSTPNIEFNVHFENGGKLRDPDHRFEWTRAEFQSWCTSNADTYGYKVEFTSVGQLTCYLNDTNPHSGVGQATQFATFILSDYNTCPSISKWPLVKIPDSMARAEKNPSQPWTHVKRICYPIPEYTADMHGITSLPITPEHLKTLNVAIRAMVDDLAPLSESNTTPLIKWCTPAHLWRLGEVRQAWRTPYAFMTFLRSPFALNYVGIMWQEPEFGDLSVLEPERVHLVFWYGEDGGKVSRYVRGDGDDDLREQIDGGSTESVVDQVLRLREIEMGMGMNQLDSSEYNADRVDVDGGGVSEIEFGGDESSAETNSSAEEDDYFVADDGDICEVEIEWAEKTDVDAWAVSPIMN